MYYESRQPETEAPRGLPRDIDEYIFGESRETIASER